MKLTRLYLRNYRTFEDPVELELPGGLVGVYGPNGAGKSYFVQAIPFALYGRTRTTKDEVRTAGVGADCVVEVEFQHEDHLYLVRRTVTGSAHTVRAEAWCDRLQVAEGARDTTRYVHSVLGMDDTAFRASVFAEQNQLAAFSQHSPAERRRLVLQLLGITPLELARDLARRDARARDDEFQRLRRVLPDLDLLGEDVRQAEAAADGAELEARSEESAAEAATAQLEAARAECERLEARRQQHELLVERGRAARAEHDAARHRAEGLTAELAELSAAAGRLAELESVAEGLGDSEEALSLLEAVVRAHQAVVALPLPDRPDPPDEEGAEAARDESDRTRSEAAELDGRLAGATAEKERAAHAVALSSELSGEACCPTCDQPLDTRAVERVHAHRASELAAADDAVRGLKAKKAEVAQRSRELAGRAERLRQKARAAREAWETWQRVADRRQAAVSALVEAVTELSTGAERSGGWWSARAAALLRATRTEDDAHASETGIDDNALSRLAQDVRDKVGEGRAAVAEAARLHGRLERREPATTELAVTRELVKDIERRLVELRREVAEVGYSVDEMTAAHTARDQASAGATKAGASARTARGAAERARARAEEAAKRLADAEHQHGLLADLGEESRHLGRLAELLGAFRNSVVATAGPQLAAQAADLFAELTDHEYDRLEVDPDTYGIQIRDQGVAHAMERFSGSETDLANLSLRVAISEQVRFQSGGAVGLLVLDEVFGPLDDDRKERMLLALERLRGRFSQVVVVTHASDIKEQLPAAVEIVKQPGRRATARLL